MKGLEGWPEESADCVRKFGHLSARLIPFIEKRVSTPRGLGLLKTYHGSTALVVLDSSKPSRELMHKRKPQKPMTEIDARKVFPENFKKKEVA